ncbi:MAG: TrmH family RNA methyltransferase [Burkholderiales bacterium]
MATVKSIQSKDNPLLVRLRKRLSDPAAYRKSGEVVLEGDHLGHALVQRGLKPEHVVITENAWQVATLQTLAMQADTVSIVSAELMKGLSALETPPPLLLLFPWTGNESVQPGHPTVVLDRLQDAGNVGTLLRSAAVFGFTQVVALKGTAALWSPKVLRAAMGAHFALHLVEGAALDDLSLLKLPMLGTSSHGTTTLHTTALPWPCAWVFGHEGQGVSNELMQRCDLTLTIAQPGGEESLNVGAAAAVCLYESARQRLLQP